MRSRSFRPLLIVIAIAMAALAYVLTPQAPAHADTPSDASTCGTVDLASSTSTDAARSFNCFSAAFAACRQATLFANGRDDAGVAVAYTFTTIDGGDDHGCSVSELVEKQNGSQKTTDSYLCRTVSKDKDGALVFGGCGTQKDVALRVIQTAGAPNAAGTNTAPR